MHDIIIDEEFRFLLPPLDSESFEKLEADILRHGCLYPLVLWNGILIDGYNRYRILTYHGLEFNTIYMEFDSREEAAIWIIENQIARRNLNSIQLSYFRGLHYNLEKELHGDIGRTALNNASSQNENLQTGRTGQRLAEQYNVSQNTILRNSKLATGLTSIGERFPEVKRKILHGEQRVSKSRLEALASATSDEVDSLAREIEEGTFVSRAPRGSGASAGSSGGSLAEDAALGMANVSADSILPEIRQLNTVISNFATSFNSSLQELNTGNPTPLKEALRSYINELESVYSSL